MISAIILAAGKSERMGLNKLLLPLGDSTVVEQVLKQVARSAIEDSVLVLGRDAEQIKKLAQASGIRVVYNPDYRSGQSSSIRTGLAQLDETSRACFFIMGDQPFITADFLNNMIALFSERSIVVPVYGDRRGAPVLFDRIYYRELAALHADNGGKAIMAKYPDKMLIYHCNSQLLLRDIDTVSQYLALRKLFSTDKE